MVRTVYIDYTFIQDEPGTVVIDAFHDKLYIQEERIKTEAIKYSYECPIRLYDVQEHKMVNRKQFAQAIAQGALDNRLQHIENSIKREDKRVSSVCRHHQGEVGDVAAALVRLPGIPSSLVRDIGRYAILSHRWQDDEILFNDMHDLSPMDSLKPESHEKFRGFCEAAVEFGCRFVWIDTLCIDNANSPELEESIRSMFSWYRNSDICIVYLGDSDTDMTGDPWFSRGWTLQELLAPMKLKFYWSDWSKVEPGSDVDIDRTSDMHVPDDLHEDISSCSDVSIAHLMTKFNPSPHLAPLMFHYISRRETSRPEDIAYSLIGLLAIEMPVAYGEGADRAFYRLQVACAQESSSRAIFHWNGYPCIWNSMLANSPDCFWNSMLTTGPDGLSHVNSNLSIRFDIEAVSGIDCSFTFTNAGLRMMMWILAPGTIRWDRTTFGWIALCTLIDFDDTFFTSVTNSIGDDFVVGIYGYDTETTYAILLKEGGRHGFTRYSEVEFTKLPTWESLRDSGKRPKWVYIK